MSEERDRSVETGMIALSAPPPYIEWDPRPDGTARAVVRMDIGRGQTLRVEGCEFTPLFTQLGWVAVDHGPAFYPLRWWERLLRRAPRPIHARMMVTGNHFVERVDG